MTTTYTQDSLRHLFQSAFNLEEWYHILQYLFSAKELKEKPEKIKGDSTEEGYYLGNIETTDSYRIGLFHYKIQEGSVANKRVGLRNLVKSFINANWGEFDAALVVFSDDCHWRLSFICDIKGEETAAKRFTYVFGNKENYYNTPVGRFINLQNKGISFKNLTETFSVEALTKEFYSDLFQWYQWAVSTESNITFPNYTQIEDDDRENIDIKIIRMITRIMFVWFIKQKKLVPEKIFDKEYLSSILKDFDCQSETDGTYYNAILQNLFFATLNRAIVDEEGNQRRFAQNKNSRDLKTLYRYAELFKISETETIKIFEEVPFLNGGLFECLDKTKTLDGAEKSFNYDGFSRNEAKFANGRYKYRAVVPNALFFKPETGLFSILNRYNFTIEENTPNEQQVALDPELLGKVFENLLGAYNPETKETARNQSGSFYTPREMVNYMVNESLIAYLGDNDFIRSIFSDKFVFDISKEIEYKEIAEKLKQIKILDPACGSGAFPMGLLNRMVDILERISPSENKYNLKLSIIENCLYGSDIQSIAAQITKLRFFISLICDCEKDSTKPNFGIPTLPNLETKFVTADTLIAKKEEEIQGYLFGNFQIDAIKAELAQIRHEHFSAKTAYKKRILREKDQKLRNELIKLLANDNYNFAPEDAKQLAEWNPYDQNTVSPFFDPEWMFGVSDGFDVVIGNPPYVQLQNNGGDLAKKYEKCNFSTYAKTGDIYCLFYERGWQLLKQKGHLCFITSNKWMRAGYGEKTRVFFATKTDPKLLIDFAGVKIFESATVDTNILLFSKSNNQHKTICAVTNKIDKNRVKNLSDFVQQQHTICNFSNEQSWVILSPIEQSIKQKIESVGTPLKDWDIKIYRGMLTGYNDAFIISTEKRDEILANCQTEEERIRTAELIRPILRGRDIKRYGYDWANLWLINTHNGIKGVKPRIDVNDYPAVKAHLDQYWDKISKRADKGDTPYNLRNCAYLEDFFKPKIVYQELTQGCAFAMDDKADYFVSNTAYLITGKYLDYLLKILNSNVIQYAYRHFYGTLLGDNGIRWLAQHIINLPIPQYKCTKIQNQIINSVIEQEIENAIYKLYNFTKEEIRSINSNY